MTSAQELWAITHYMDPVFWALDLGAGDVPGRNIHAHVALKRAIDARVELAFGGTHYELDHFAFWNAGPLSEFRRDGIRRPMGVVAIGEVLSPRGEVQ